MNEKFVRHLIDPYIFSVNKVRFRDFDDAFSMLGNREKYEVVDLLYAWDIDLVDDDYRVDSLGNTTIRSNHHTVEKVTSRLDDGGKRKYSYDEVSWKTKIFLTNEQLCVMHQKGDSTALSKLMVNNMRFVYKEANKYAKAYSHKLDLEDLVQAGYIGLIKAADKFDLAHDNKFLSYAGWWVMQSILRSIADEGFTIRIPVHVFEKINAINRIEKENFGCNCEQLIEFVSKELEMNRHDILFALELRDQIMSPASLNVSISEESEGELIDFIPNEQEHLEDVIVDQMYKDEIRDIAMSILTKREFYILNRMYGLEDGTTRTLEDVGFELGLTRERVRQIKTKALRKLREHLCKRKYY